MAGWLMMNTTETARTLRSRVFNGGDHNPLIIYGGHLLVNVHVPRLSRLWRNKKNHLAMHSELWQFLRWKKILRKLFKRSVFPLMKIKKGMYKCTCAGWGLYFVCGRILLVLYWISFATNSSIIESVVARQICTFVY